MLLPNSQRVKHKGSVVGHDPQNNLRRSVAACAPNTDTETLDFLNGIGAGDSATKPHIGPPLKEETSRFLLRQVFAK